MEKEESLLSKTKPSVRKYLPVKMDRKAFVFQLEFDTAEGVEGTNFQSPTTSGVEYTSVEMIRAAIPCNGVRVWTNPDAKRMERADTRNHFALVDFWLSSDQQKNVAKLYPHLSYQEYLDTQVSLLRSLMGRDGERVWWSICGEQDGGVYWPKRLFISKAEAFKYYEECYLTNLPGRYNTNRKMADFIMMRERYHVDFAKDNIAIHISRCFSTHYPYEWGARLVWCERTGTLGSAQVVVAFMRGAARQYGGYWGLDISGWNGCVEGACFYDKDRRQISGVSDNLVLREMIAYFHSGSNILHVESTASSCWIKKDEGNFELSPFGEKCRAMGDHSLVRNPDRGEPVAPFAVLLEHDHGWDPRDHLIWEGHVNYGPGDHMIDDFFNFVFPGQEENCVFPNDAVAADLARRRSIQDKGVVGPDALPLEKGLLAASRFGDSFDVVLENCTLDVLRHYRVVFVTGDIKVNTELRDKLLAYASGGGTVVLNIRHLDGLEPDCMGVRHTGKTTAYAKFSTAWGIVWDEGPTMVEMVETLPGVETLVTARRGDETDTPAITRMPVGKGAVCLTLVPYARKSLAKPMAVHCQDFLGRLFREHLPVMVEGSGIQWMAGKKENSMLLTLINNSPDKWTGRIISTQSGRHFTSGSDLWKGKLLGSKCFDADGVALSCAPFSFRVVELKYN